MMGKRVLQNADHAAREQASQRTAPRGRKTDCDQQRKIEDGEKRKPQRQPRLQENCGQRNQNRRRNTETINFDLLSRCVGDGHVSADYPRQRVAVQVRPSSVPWPSQDSEKLSQQEFRLLSPHFRRECRRKCRRKFPRKFRRRLPTKKMESSQFFARRARRCRRKPPGARLWA